MDPDPGPGGPQTYEFCGSGSPQHCRKHCFLFHVLLPLLVHRVEEVAPEVALSGLKIRPLVGGAQRPRPEALVEDGRGGLGEAQGGTGRRRQPAGRDLRTARTRWHFAATSNNYVKAMSAAWGGGGGGEGQEIKSASLEELTKSLVPVSKKPQKICVIKRDTVSVPVV